MSIFSMNSKLPLSSNSVEINSILMSFLPPRCEAVLAAQPLCLTFFNNKIGCNTSPVTVTLPRQPTYPHSLNLHKSVTPLLHFQPQNSQLSSGITKNLTFH